MLSVRCSTYNTPRGRGKGGETLNTRRALSEGGERAHEYELVKVTSLRDDFGAVRVEAATPFWALDAVFQLQHPPAAAHLTQLQHLAPPHFYFVHQ